MRTPPRFEKRPTALFYLGQAIGKHSLSGSWLLNVLRLSGTALLVPQLPRWLGGDGQPALTALGCALLLLGLVVQPRRKQPTHDRERWTRPERRVAAAVQDAWQRGTPTVAAQQRVLHTAAAIDYGVTGDGRPVCVGQELRQAHQLITGGSNSGKSKFVASQASQAALLGSSLVVIDPHEELALDILRAVPELLAERGVVLLWPGNPTGKLYPWNPLWTGPQRPAWQVADSTVGAVKRVWQLTDANTYILDVVRHTAWALAAAGWTLLEAQRFLVDDHFRDYVATRANVSEVSMWVNTYNGMRRREQLELTGTTLVRLARLRSNPHVKLMVGAGVSDQRYRDAMRRGGHTPSTSAELGAAFNRGQHVFAALPRRSLGEDQYLIAGLVQAACLEAIFRRQPADPTMPETEAYFDEAGAYANSEGLGVVLAQARKFRFNAVVVMQGLHQADPALQHELWTNTAIKAVFATDHPEEALNAAASLYRYDPLLVKVDARQRVGDTQNRRDVGAFQTYPPGEQHAFYASQINHLQPRQYVLKVRGQGDALEVRTPTFYPRFPLSEAIARVSQTPVADMIEPRILLAELNGRDEWLDQHAFRPQVMPSALPVLGPETQPFVPSAASSIAAQPSTTTHGSAANIAQPDALINTAADAPLDGTLPITLGGDDGA